MVRNNIFSYTIAVLFALSVSLAGCDNPGTNVTDGTGTLEVLLHDAPADYQEVNVFIERVEVNNAKDDTGWVEIATPQQTYNLLELTNGATEELGTAELPAGTYEQIRLILGSEGHSVVIDSVEHGLFVPSGEQTGIKLVVNAEIEEGQTYTLLLDFDAARSVVKRGNSGRDFLLKPVIKASSQATTGSIAGAVEPADAGAFVYAIMESDTVSSTKADTSDGAFKLIGLEEGTYTVSADPSDENYQSADTTGVEVTAGETTDIGTIDLPEQE